LTVEIDATTTDAATATVGTDGSSGAHERPYGIVLDVFEGPLDLLLYLIRKNEVDIYDIPISTITAQYLAVINGQLRLPDIEVASGFILMAATLMKIKSQILLPREVEPGMEDVEGDPREELIRRLLEYQQFKEIAEWLGEQGLERRDVFPPAPGPIRDADGIEIHPVSLFDLLKVYKHVLDHVPDSLVHRIVGEEITIEECIERILSALGRKSRLRFFELVEGRSRQSVVATFVGILELLKSRRIRVQQAQPFDEIWIEPLTDVAAGGDAESSVAITTVSSHQEAGEAAGAGDR
jgi:segregation and condensation protein A